MRSTRQRLVFMATWAFCLAMAASASAASFLSSAKEKLLSEKVATQEFVTDQGTMECTTVKVTSGESSGTETTEQAVTVKYEGCKSFGFVSIDVSPAEYVFLASGEVHLTKTVTWTILGLGCVITYPAQLFSRADYQTKGRNLLLTPLYTGIHYTAGSGCSPSGNLTNGTFKGTLELMLANGTLSFMP